MNAMPDCSDSAIGATVAGMLAASERVLYLRLDGIGDTVLANGALARLAALMPKARVTVVCDTPVAPVYEACPLVDRVVPLSRWGLVDESYLAGAVRLLKALRPDTVLTITRSSAREHCLLALSLGVPVIALENDLANMGHEDKAFFQEKTCCIPSPDPGLTEPERYADMLRRLGLPFDNLEPLIWLTDEDRRKAAEIWAETGFAPKKTIAIFGAGSAFIRAYLGFGQALRDICKARGLSVVALGAAQDASVNGHLLAPLREAGVPAMDLAGRLSLRESSAVLGDCLLAVGVETSLAHIAAALGVPQVIVLGGGHFGRFMPTHRTTTAVILPLDCFACNWSCRYAKPYCIRDIRPQTVAQAVEGVLATKGSERRRTLFAQHPDLTRPGPDMPVWRLPAEYIRAAESRPANGLDVVISE